MLIRVENKNRQSKIIQFLTVFILYYLSIKNILGLPSLLNYCIDAIIIILFFQLIFSKYTEKYYKICLYWVISFFIYTLCTYIINKQPIIQYTWGLRNNFRFYIFFFACIVFLQIKDIQSIFRIFKTAYFINLVLCLFEYFVLHKKGDYLGGIFGIQQGCNGYLNVFLVISCTYQILQYLNRRINIGNGFFVIASASLIAALSELKAFYLELIVIIALGVLLTKFSWRKLSLVFICIVSLVVTINILGSIFPGWQDFFTFNRIYGSLTNGYSNSQDLGRFSAIATINKTVFENQILQKIIGLGLGSCDYSSNIMALVSIFYIKYSYLHYQWISIAWLYLETGYIGLVFFNGFFIIILVTLTRIRNKSSSNDLVIYSDTGIIIIICCIIMEFYNISLRQECVCLIYLMLSIPYVYLKNIPINSLACKNR